MPLYITDAQTLMFNVRDYGATGNGTTDDTAAIAAAIAVASVNGGIVFFPPGTYLTGNQTLSNMVYFTGAGAGATIIKLKNSANVDLFSAYTSSINLSGTSGAGSATGVVQFGFRNLTLDGNKANQTGGTSYPLRYYGYGSLLESVEIRNGYSGGILCDWYNTADPSGISVINHWRDVEVHNCNGIGIETGGPTDQQWVNVNSYKNVSHSFHIAPNAISCLLVNCHGWEQNLGVSALCLLSEAGGTKLVNCAMEGSDTCQVVILANDNEIQGGEIFPGFTNTATGIQLGQTASNTPYPGQIKQSAGVTTAVQVSGTMINTKIDNCVGAAIDYQNEINNDITALIWANGGNVLKSGRTPNYIDRIFHNVNGTTPDGSLNTCPRYAYGGAGYNMFTLLGANGTPLLNANGTNNILSIANSTKLYGYSDYYTTQTYSVDMATGDIATSGNLATGQSATAAAVASSGTITTTNIGEARVSPTAAVTGVILQAGTVAGQEVWVVNEAVAANSVTFAASGTSHVADGTSSVIAGLRSAKFVWDSSTSLWYRG